MTWVKLGDEFFDECADAGLTDAAVRTHIEGVGFLYRLERENLEVQRRLLRRFAGSADAETAMHELVAVGFWRENRNGWVLVHHAEVVRQSLAAQQAKRDRDKKAQQAKRGRDKEGREHKRKQHVSDVVSADVVATQADRQPALEETSELLPMRDGESAEEYEVRFNNWDSAKAGGDDDPADHEFLGQTVAYATR
jgi:hypothetical protein